MVNFASGLYDASCTSLSIIEKHFLTPSAPCSRSAQRIIMVSASCHCNESKDPTVTCSRFNSSDVESLHLLSIVSGDTDDDRHRLEILDEPAEDGEVATCSVRRRVANLETLLALHFFSLFNTTFRLMLQLSTPNPRSAQSMHG
jgi:hypothetical protein